MSMMGLNQYMRYIGVGKMKNKNPFSIIFSEEDDKKLETIMRWNQERTKSKAIKKMIDVEYKRIKYCM